MIVEITIMDYLKSMLKVPVFLEEPETKSESYILIQKTGGSTSNKIKKATIVVQSIAKSMYNAAKLNEDVKEAMDTLVTLDAIGACRLNSDYNFTDTETKRHRYQAVFDVVFY